MSYTCPLPRCRLPLRTIEDVHLHLMNMAAEENVAHDPRQMSRSVLIECVNALVMSCVRLEESCGYYKSVADSYREADDERKMRQLGT